MRSTPPGGPSPPGDFLSTPNPALKYTDPQNGHTPLVSQRGVHFGWMRLVSRVLSGAWFLIRSLTGALWTRPLRLGNHFSARMVAHTMRSVRSQHPTRAHWSDRPELCLGLHAMGFTLPRLSPTGRCALTAPFHPYLFPVETGSSAVHSLWHFPSPPADPCGLLGRVGVTHHRVLSCSDFPPMDSRP